MQSLGISPDDRLRLVNEVDLIINCAASVNFDDPLLDAIQINYFGCYRMLELAKECKKLLSFTHVSTAYVNSNRTGFIEEKIYDLPGVSDPEEEIARIQKLSPQFISENEMKLIHKYPNTYTFTKSMAERMLKKNSGNLKITIIRPSIIISCYDEPLSGWTETLAAAGGITLTAALGLLRNIQVDVSQILDLVPCDTVSNLILAASAATSMK